MRNRWLGVVLLLLGCSEDTADVSLVTYARVVGVRVEAAEDAERSTPRNDEGANAQVLVIGPNGSANVTYAMLLCAAAPQNGTLPACAGPTLATNASSNPTATPELSWSELEDTSGANELLILGTVCEQGTPVLDPNAVGQCEEPESRGVSFANHVTLLNAEESNTNHHPSLDAAQLTLDADPWNAGDCGATLPRDGKERTITLTLGDARREQIDGENEELLLSWFATDGELSQHFSVLEVDDTEDRTLELTWTAPKANVTPERETAIFTLVLRDQRGGIDWLTRTLCFE